MNLLPELKLKRIIFLYLIFLAAGIGYALESGMSPEVLWLLLFISFVSLATLLILSVYYFRFKKQLQENSQAITDQVTEKINQTFTQAESFYYLTSLIRPQMPLPPTRGWAASPDLLSLAFKYILINKPAVIVELGSGTSTLFIGHLLRDHPVHAKLISVDHDSAYAALTHENIRNAGLQEQVKIFVCPIQPVMIHGKAWLWYTLTPELPGSIDMLLIDGPIGSLQHKARYPALPLLFEKLTIGAMVLLDDYDRPDEIDVVQDWLNEFPGLELLSERKTEKGTAVLRKKF